MLVLTRRDRESIVILCGDKKIEMTVSLSIDGGLRYAKLLFSGDDDMKVYRKELLDKDHKIPKTGLIKKGKQG